MWRKRVRRVARLDEQSRDEADLSARQPPTAAEIFFGAEDGETFDELFWNGPTGEYDLRELPELLDQARSRSSTSTSLSATRSEFYRRWLAPAVGFTLTVLLASVVGDIIDTPKTAALPVEVSATFSPSPLTGNDGPPIERFVPSQLLVSEQGDDLGDGTTTTLASTTTSTSSVFSGSSSSASVTTSTAASGSVTTSSVTAATTQSSTTPTTDSGSTSTVAGSTSATTTSAESATSTEVCTSWTLVVDEDFDGQTLDPVRWDLYSSPGADGFGLRRPSAITVDGGLLTIEAAMVDNVLVSGGLKLRLAQTYGRYEIRVRTDADPSQTMRASVFTWPSSEAFPVDGSSGVYQALAVNGEQREFSSIFHPAGGDGQGIRVHHPGTGSDWHTLMLEWTPDALLLYRDGELAITIDGANAYTIPDMDHALVIQLDATADLIPGPVQMQVDYVRVERLEDC